VVIIFSLLIVSGLGARELIVLDAVVNFFFITFYFPVFGYFLGIFGSEDIPPLEAYVGVRSFIYSLLLLVSLGLLVFAGIRRGALQRELLCFGLGICYLILMFYISPASLFGKVAYLFNSFLPLVLTLVAIVWLATRANFSRSCSFVLYSAAFVVILLCGLYTLCIDFIYTYVRPDLVSIMRSNSSGPLSYGAYPGSWQTVIGSFQFNRLVGVFPDPIIGGYFFALFAATSWVMKRYVAFLFGLVFLLLSLSKGAWVFLFTFTLIYYLFLLRIRIFWLPVLAVAGLQMLSSTLFHSSAFIHYQGLVGAISSLLSDSGKMLFGFGVGSGGNLAAFRGEEWNRASSLATGAESGVGVLLFQLGLVGVGLLVWLVNYTKKRCYYNYKMTGNRGSLAIMALVGALVANAFMQENCINASLMGLLLYFCCVLSHLPARCAKNGIVYV
jgi:hypothetical protein